MNLHFLSEEFAPAVIPAHAGMTVSTLILVGVSNAYQGTFSDSP